MSATQFDRATAVAALGSGRYAADIDPQWSIGGRPNGGYLMAILARAACLEVSAGVGSGDAAEPAVDPLAVSASFPASPAPGPVEVAVEVVRRGRAFATVHARMTQDDAPQVDALITCGRLPEPSTATRHDGSEPPRLPPIEECFELPTEGPGFEVLLMGVVRQRLDPAVLGWTRGQLGPPEVRGYVALADGREPDPLSLVLVVDAAPPPTFALGVRGWVPTLQLSAWVRRRPAPGPLVLRSRPSLVLASDDGTGFTDETCEVWDSTGALVATGTQLAGLRHG